MWGDEQTEHTEGPLFDRVVARYERPAAAPPAYARGEDEEIAGRWRRHLEDDRRERTGSAASGGRVSGTCG